MSLVFPKYSFVQDGSVAYPDCYPDDMPCLPLSSWNNLQFQMELTDVSGPKEFLSGVSGSGSLVYITPVPVDFDCTPHAQTLDGLKSFPFAHHPSVLADYTIMGSAATLYFNLANDGGNMDLTTQDNSYTPVPIGSCFKFAIIWDIYSSGELIARYYYGCTNCFTRIDTSGCYTSVVRYTNTTNAFDFDYEDAPEDYQNIIELPVYLRDPAMENDLKVYTRSDGTMVKIYERKDEVYQLETDMMPYMWHKDLDIALSHDAVTISNTNASSFDPLNTATQFVKKDAYEIEYNKAPLSAFGKGKCKLHNADPVHLINNNCA